MATTVAEGGCICGAIRYAVSGKPTNSMVCHCQTCREWPLHRWSRGSRSQPCNLSFFRAGRRSFIRLSRCAETFVQPAELR